jgi:hypothetical protein
LFDVSPSSQINGFKHIFFQPPFGAAFLLGEPLGQITIHFSAAARAETPSHPIFTMSIKPEKPELPGAARLCNAGSGSLLCHHFM